MSALRFECLEHFRKGGAAWNSWVSDLVLLSRTGINMRAARSRAAAASSVGTDSACGPPQRTQPASSRLLSLGAGACDVAAAVGAAATAEHGFSRQYRWCREFRVGYDLRKLSHSPKNAGCKGLRISPLSFLMPTRRSEASRTPQRPGNGSNSGRAHMSAPSVRERRRPGCPHGRGGWPVNGHDALEHENAAQRAHDSALNAAIVRNGANLDLDTVPCEVADAGGMEAFVAPRVASDELCNAETVRAEEIALAAPDALGVERAAQPRHGLGAQLREDAATQARRLGRPAPHRQRARRLLSHAPAPHPVSAPRFMHRRCALPRPWPHSRPALSRQSTSPPSTAGFGGPECRRRCSGSLYQPPPGNSARHRHPDDLRPPSPMTRADP